MTDLKKEIIVLSIALFLMFMAYAMFLYATGSAAVYSLVQELWWGHV